jgi:Uma2 family endonuclease
MNDHFRPPALPKRTQAAEGLMRRSWTVAEVEAMVKVGLIEEHERVELIGGELVPMSPKGSKHESYKASLLDFWMRRRGESYRIIQETTFRLDEASYLEPDFVFYSSMVKVPDIGPGNTLLAVEIADSSLNFDKGRKARIYANHGVKTLWVIDVNTLTTHVFCVPGIDGYKQISSIRPEDLLAPDFAPELAIRLNDLPLI